jgi:methylmalonyl-CoA mutase C-terminal domain/subunit
MTILPRILKLLKARKAGDMIVIAGGIIPADDAKKLERMGVRRLFGPGTPTSEIVDWIRANVARSPSPRKKKTTAVAKRRGKRK